jgi:hypothetical protein
MASKQDDDLDALFDEISFDPEWLPKKPPPADELEAEIETEEIVAAAKVLDYDAAQFAVTGPNTFAFKHQLKTLGCRWNGKHWIAKDAAMHGQALLVMGLKQKSTRTMPNRHGNLNGQKILGVAMAGTPAGKILAYSPQTGLATVAVGFEPQPAAPAGPELIPDDVLARELEKRGYSVRRIDDTQSLAEVLADDDSENAIDKLEKLLEEM